MRVSFCLRLSVIALLVGCGPKFKFPDFRTSTTPDSTVYAGAPAVMLVHSDIVEFDDEGSAIIKQFRRIKIFTPEGRTSREVRLPFTARQKLNFFDGRTVCPQPGGDDRVITMPSGGAVIKRSEFSRDYGEVILTFAEAEPDCVFDYVAIYRLTDAAYLAPIVMRDRLRVERADVTVLAPKGFELDLRYLERGEPKNVAPQRPSEDFGSNQAYRFIAVDLPPLTKEEFQPAPDQTGPTIAIGLRQAGSTKMQRWEDVGEWLKSRWALGDHGDGKVDEDKVRSAFVAHSLATKLDDLGLRLGERGGRGGSDRLELGMAMYQALRAQGLAVMPAFVAREESGVLRPDLPSPAVFDAVLAAYDVDGKTFYLDPTCPSCPRDQVSAALEKAPVVVFSSNGARVEQLPERQSLDNGVTVSFDLALGDRGQLTGTGTAVLSGAPAAQARSAYLKKDFELLKSELGLAKALTISNLQTPDAPPSAATFELAFDVTGACVDDGNARLRCSSATWSDGILPAVWREARTRDLLLPMAVATNVVAHVRLKTRARIGPALPLELKNRNGEYSLKFKVDKDAVTYSRRFLVSSRRISTEEYTEFFKFIRDARAADGAGPTFEIFAEGEAIPEDKPAKETKPVKKKGK